jgi:hypothetical protein
MVFSGSKPHYLRKPAFYDSVMPKSYLPLRSLVAGSSLAILTIHTAVASDWSIRNPRLTGPALNALAASESRAVAVGLQGHVATSTDGANWSPQTVGTNRHLHDIIYANNTFVAVGALHNDSGVHSLALTSTDGLTWTEQPTDSRAWKSIAHGNGTFVVVGDHTIDTSTDGVAWTRQTPFAYVNFQAVAFGNGQFVTTGVFNDGRGNFYYSVQRSTDGVTWSGGPAPANVTMRGIAFGNGQFVMVGDGGTNFTSPDGVAWTPRYHGYGTAWRDVAYASDRFVAVGDGGGILGSTDGVSWWPPIFGERQNLYGAATAFGRPVAVGENSSIVGRADGGTWSSLVSVSPQDLRGITFAQGRIVAVGTRCEATHSTDGHAWLSSEIIRHETGPVNTWMNGVAYGNGTYVAVGGLGGPIFTSPDAQDWTQRNWDLGVNNWRAAAFNNGRFVIVGETSSGEFPPRSSIQSSTDGVNWTRTRFESAGLLHCVAHGNGVWVAAGNDLYTSTDASSWTPRTIPTTGMVYAATFAAGRFVLAGELGGVLTSSDGTSWTHQSAFGNATVRGLAYGNNQFVAVGERGRAGVIWSSADGLTWTEDASAPVPLNAVTFGGGAFTAVGANGFVLQSGGTTASIAIRKVPNGSIELSCRTEIGRQYRLQASSDGRAWADMANFRAASTASTYRIVDAATVRLYRLVSP